MYINDYNPTAKTEEMLDRAWQHAQSVPYKVSARWLFYRLLQDGFFNKKSDYKNKFLKAISTARKCFYKKWRPDSLEDDTRSAVTRGRGHDNPKEFLESVVEDTHCYLDYWNDQSYYIEIWFEARAMSRQFEYYTEHITLRPMAGQPSIPYKWEIAKDLERCSRWYKDKPIIILYFGDLDPAGQTIADSVLEDVQNWCNAPFEFIFCGLTQEQVDRFNVPENPEKAGYQWEALTDYGAETIIEESIADYIDHDAFDAVAELEEKVNQFIKFELVDFADKWEDDLDDY